MSHPEHLLAHMTYMRVRASVLQHGDKDAREHAKNLHRQADKIERDLVQGAGSSGRAA